MKRLLIIGAAVFALSACNDQSQSNNSNVTVVKPSQQPPKASQPAKKWTWLDRYNEVPYTSDKDLMRKNYVFVFDGSGSMGGERIIIAKKAAKAFSQKVTNDDVIGLVVFDNSGTDVRVPLGTNNKAAFDAAVDRIDVGGGTPLESSINIGYQLISKQGSKQRGYGEYNIIVVTDGEAGMGQDPGNLVRQIVQQSPVNVYTIGFQFDGDHSLNQKGYTTYYQADNYNQLVQSFDSILAESNTFDPASFD